MFLVGLSFLRYRRLRLRSSALVANCCAIAVLDANGDEVTPHRSCGDLFYCGRRLGVAAIPDSDGLCGPDGGPQCAACQRFRIVGSDGGVVGAGASVVPSLLAHSLGAIAARAARSGWAARRGSS